MERIVVNGKEIIDPIEIRIWTNYQVVHKNMSIFQLLSCNAPLCDECLFSHIDMYFLHPNFKNYHYHQFCVNCFNDWKNRQPLIETNDFNYH